MQRAWPTHLWGREGDSEGYFSSWNTQGLATLTSLNLICIRAVFGGKHRFSLWGDIWGHGKQQQTVDLCLLPLQWVHRGRQETVFPDLRHIHTHIVYTHQQTLKLISCFPPNYVYIMKSNLSTWNASSDPASTFPQLDFLKWRPQILLFCHHKQHVVIFGAHQSSALCVCVCVLVLRAHTKPLSSKNIS